MSSLRYDELKAMAAQLGRPLHSLIALSDDNDPFLCNRPGRRLERAQWFADLWDRLEILNGVHLRRLHYILISTPGITRPDGRLYTNTHDDWKLLGWASQDARYLDLVDAGAFVDRRAPEPITYMPEDEGSPASIYVASTDPWVQQADSALLDYQPCDYSFPDLPRLDLAEPTIAEPYAIELWIEKSTMNDILLPLAERLRVGLVTGLGELSVTACHALASRVREHRRRTRILYISDHDPAGDGMPVSVARKIEFFLNRSGDDLDIRLIPIALTWDQVDEHDLPRMPIKESDRRRAQFEERHGEGAVELDALEALHPGTLARIVRDAVDVYRAPTRKLRGQIVRKAATVRRQLRKIEETVAASHEDALDDLRGRWETAQAEIEQRQEAIADAIADAQRIVHEHEAAIEEQLSGFQGHVEPVWERMREDLDAAKPAEIAWPEIEEAAEPEEPLYDSRRRYLDQMTFYKTHQGKPLGIKRGNGQP